MIDDEAAAAAAIVLCSTCLCQGRRKSTILADFIFDHKMSKSPKNDDDVVGVTRGDRSRVEFGWTNNRAEPDSTCAAVAVIEFNVLPREESDSTLKM